MEHSGLELEQLKYRRLEGHVWARAEQELGQHRTNLQRFWHSKLHVQLFVRYNVRSKRLLKCIFKIIKKSGYQVWSDVRWKEMAERFPDGFTPHFLYKAATNVIKTQFKSSRKVPMEEIIRHFEQKIKVRRSYDLKTLTYVDGKLQRITYEVDLPKIK